MSARSMVYCFAAKATLAESAYPEHPNVVNVRKAPYFAKGEGVTNDTAAWQKAIDGNVGWHRAINRRQGKYLFRPTLNWSKRYGGRDTWGFTIFVGESHETARIRLLDSTATNPDSPLAIMRCGGFGSDNCFYHHLENPNFDTGKGNPVAIAPQFFGSSGNSLVYPTSNSRSISCTDADRTGIGRHIDQRAGGLP